MESFAWTVGSMGFIFGMMAIAQAMSALSKIEKVEQRLSALEGNTKD